MHRVPFFLILNQQQEHPGPTTLLWILGHKGIPGNELAGTAAKAAASTTSDPPRSIYYAPARSLIRKTLIDPPPANSRTAEVYGGFSWSKNCKAPTTEPTRSSLPACEPATLHCRKPTPISSTPPHTPCVPFTKRSRRQSIQFAS